MDNSIWFMQEEPEPIINPVNENTYNEANLNPYSESKINIDPVVNNSWNNVNWVNNSWMDSNWVNNISWISTSIDWINNINIEDITPIGSMQRPSND